MLRQYVCLFLEQECSWQWSDFAVGSFLFRNSISCQDNEVVYSKETEWDVTNADPQYHYDAILAALKLAKDTLPKAMKNSTNLTQQSPQIPAFRPDGTIFARISIANRDLSW